MEGNAEIQESQYQRQLKPESRSIESAEAGWLRGLKDRLNKGFRREQKPTEPFPQVSVDIFFSSHVTHKDMEGLTERFEKADIFIPETVGWDPSLLEDIRSVSEGKRNYWEADSSSFVFGLMEMIYKSNKPIAFVDLPFNHPLIKKVEKMKRNRLLLSSFPKCLQSIDAGQREFVEYQKKREEYMISQLKPTIQELLEKYPGS